MGGVICSWKCLCRQFKIFLTAQIVENIVAYIATDTFLSKPEINNNDIRSSGQWICI